MFIKKFPKMAVSDEGFIVQTKDRFTIQYIENSGITIEVYRDPGEVTGFCKTTMKPTKLPNGMTSISEEYKEKIIQRISAAADFLGWKYEWY